MQVTIIGAVALPEVGEEQSAAHARFEAGVETVLQICPGTTLIVTHGDAVAAAVSLANSRALVYAVKTTGYVCLERQGASSVALSLAESDGVNWFDQ